MKVDLDGLDLTGICSAAIVQSLDENKKDAMIRGAIEYLFNPKEGAYSKRPPIQEAYEQAVRQETIKLLREELTKNGTLDDRIASVLREAINRAFSAENRETMINKIADQISQGLRLDTW